MGYSGKIEYAWPRNEQNSSKKKVDKNKNDLFELGYKSGVNSGELAFAIKIVKYCLIYSTILLYYSTTV